MSCMFALTGPHVEPSVGHAPAAIVVSAHTAVVHFGAGREVRSFQMREPEGVILHYWISAPAGARVRGWAQVPHLTARLEIRTAPNGPRSGIAIGRIGDIINGEHHGVHAPGFPLAVVYTNPNPLGEPGIPRAGWTASIPAPPRVCAKAWKRRSPSSGCSSI